MAESWVFHKTEKAKIIDDCELENYLSAGWAETPAAFHEENKPGKKTEVSRVSIEDLSLIEGLSKANLRTFAEKRFKAYFEERLNKVELMDEIKKLLQAENGNRA